MIVTVDQKRRVVLPKPVQPGDALDVSVLGQRMILQILTPVSARALKPSSFGSVDLDEPAFAALSDESPA